MRYNLERHDGGRNLVVIIFISNREVSPAKKEEENIVQSDKHVCCLLLLVLSLEEVQSNIKVSLKTLSMYAHEHAQDSPSTWNIWDE